MKRVYLIFLFLANVFFIFSQNYQSLENIEEYKTYFKNNISNLDPIEGIYDVENSITIHCNTNSPQLCNQYLTIAIIKDHSNKNELSFYAISISNEENEYRNVFWGKAKRIGDTLYYKFTYNLTEKTIRFQFKDNSFKYSFISNNNGVQSKTSVSALKEYPTQQMYNHAIKEL
ncbi:MAG TPA: hypothetical protein H9807_06210 [Candidatus Bacteroides merdavium]|uniref:Uncharacterized protein n=1 Tax=Candidatus Bacteroides merdavium TaxID=2838472 RepID=A0A9D2GYH4_9BACE|nr:hypothetical protein [Candidatus Bacteroides merdavium]